MRFVPNVLRLRASRSAQDERGLSSGGTLLLALVLGVASAFAFEPVGLWPAMFVAFAILCEMTARAPILKRALLIGWGFGVGQFCLGLNWIATAFTFQAAMPAWLGWIAVVLLSLYLAIYPMLATGLAWRFGRDHRLALVLALAGGWAITEWLRATMFTGFAWNPVGVTLIDFGYLDLATVVGTYGLSAIVVILGGALYLLAHRAWEGALLLSIITIAAGLNPSLTLSEGGGSERPIRIVQPNIGQQDKWKPGFSEEAARRLASLSALPGGERPRLLFWPEAAVTEPLDDARTGEHQAYAEFERTRAAALVGPGEFLITGGIALNSSDGRTVDGAANSVFVIGPGGNLVARYDKAHLVPYGEYLPMRPLLSAIGLSRLAPGDLDFNPGPGPQTVALPGWGRIGFQLCYEIIFSGEVLDRRNRPQVIFNPSNDAWFGGWGPPQHLAQARLRAAEEGVPIIRSTPTGISALIDAHGRIVRALPLNEAGIIDAHIPPAAVELSLFARFGNIIPLALGFLLLIGAIALDRRRRYRRT